MNDGSCNHMTCAVCGCEFCWLCMKEISDLHYLRSVCAGGMFYTIIIHRFAVLIQRDFETSTAGCVDLSKRINTVFYDGAGRNILPSGCVTRTGRAEAPPPLCSRPSASLSPSGCTFWGKKPWSRKKKILWQLGTLVGAPVGIALIAGIAVPAMIIGIPVYVGRKVRPLRNIVVCVYNERKVPRLEPAKKKLAEPRTPPPRQNQIQR